jgi:hypothetical protein
MGVRSNEMPVNPSHFGPILKLLEGEFSAIIGLNSSDFIPWCRCNKVFDLILPVPFVRANKLFDDDLSFRFGLEEADFGLSIEVIDYEKPVSSSTFDSGCKLAATANVNVDEVSCSLRAVENWPSIRLVRRSSDSTVSARPF